MKKLILVFLFSFIHLHAMDKNNIPTQIQNKFEQIVQTYYGPIKSAANGIFWSMALIEIVTVFGFMLLRGELEIGGIFAQLMKILLLFGVFTAILESPGLLKTIYQGFDQLGSQAANVKFDTVLDKLFEMWVQIWDKSSIWEPGTSIVFALAGFIATLSLVALVAQGLMYYAFLIFSVYVGIFWLGFGSFSQTRQWAINAIVSPMRWGAKWMMILLLMGVTFAIIDDVLSSELTSESVITLVIVSFMMVTVSSGVSGFVDGYFSGNGGGDNGRGVALALAMAGAAAGAVGGAAAGAVSGAKGASDTIAAAKENGSTSAIGNASRMAGGIIGGAAAGAVKGLRGQHSGSSSTMDQSTKDFITKVTSTLGNNSNQAQQQSGNSGTITKN